MGALEPKMTTSAADPSGPEVLEVAVVAVAVAIAVAVAGFAVAAVAVVVVAGVVAPESPKS